MLKKFCSLYIYKYDYEKLYKETIYISEIFSQKLQNSEMNDLTYNELFLYYKNIDFLYDITLRFVQTSQIINDKENEKQRQIKNIKNISSSFYDGFGIKID